MVDSNSGWGGCMGAGCGTIGVLFSLWVVVEVAKKEPNTALGLVVIIALLGAFIYFFRFTDTSTGTILGVGSLVIVGIPALFIFREIAKYYPGAAWVIGIVTLVVGGGVGWSKIDDKRQKDKIRAQEAAAAAAEKERIKLTPRQTVRFLVRVPRGQKWQPATAVALIRALLEMADLSNEGYLTLNIATDGEQISWSGLIHSRSVNFDRLRAVITGFYPQAEVENVEWVLTIAEGLTHKTLAIQRNTGVDHFLPLLTASEASSPDPLALLTQVMGEMRPGEMLMYSVDIFQSVKETPEAIKYLLSQTMAEAGQELPRYRMPKGFSEAVAEGVWRGWLENTRRVPKFTPSEERRMRSKLEQNMYVANVYLEIGTEEPERFHLLSAANAPLKAFMHPHYPLIEGAPIEEGEAHKAFKRYEQNRVDGLAFFLSPEELAALWHLPHSDFNAPQIEWVRAHQVKVPAAVAASTSGVCLGENYYGGKTTPVYFKDIDRTTHMIVFGKTGVGKSTFLHNLIAQDIAAGRGVAVIDPHRDLVADILASSIPPERADDVVVWDLSNTEFPPPLNLLSVPEGADRRVASGQILGILEKTYGNFGSTRMADSLRMALELLMTEEKPTIRDISRLFRDDEYRWNLLSKADNPAAEDFWTEFEAAKSGRQDELAAPILWRMREFYGNSTLYPIMCHPQNLSFSQLISENKIILISLRSPENVVLAQSDLHLLGALLVSQFQLAVMAGAAREPSFYLYVDEAQHFVTTAIPEIFNEARKRNLSLTLSNQFLEQLTGDTLTSVMGNVGAMVAFACGEKDAKAVSAYMKPDFEAGDLINLDPFAAAVKIRVDNTQQSAFSLSTRPAPKPDEATIPAADVIERSRQKYTPKSRDEVLGWLKEKYARQGGGKASSEVEFSDPVE